MKSNVTFSMHMNGVEKDATEYVNRIARVAILLLDITDRNIVDKLLTQVGQEEKIFIESALAGVKHHSQ